MLSGIAHRAGVPLSELLKLNAKVKAKQRQQRLSKPQIATEQRAGKRQAV